MRILWFSVTPSLFNPHSNGHNGGGWIASLEQIVRKNRDIELGVVFYFQGSTFKYNMEGVTYYPVKQIKVSYLSKLFEDRNNKTNIKHYLEIIDDFKPDIIHIFGSENDFGLICEHSKTPVVIHIQGCLPPYHNALFPVGMKQSDFIFKKGLSLS